MIGGKVVDAANARQVDRLLTKADMFDAMAGHVVHVARQRSWPALSADPGRLRRIDPGLEIDLLLTRTRTLAQVRLCGVSSASAVFDHRLADQLVGERRGSAKGRH